MFLMTSCNACNSQYVAFAVYTPYSSSLHIADINNNDYLLT